MVTWGPRDWPPATAASGLQEAGSQEGNLAGGQGEAGGAWGGLLHFPTGLPGSMPRPRLCHRKLGELFYIGDFKTIITLCVRNVQRNL